MEAYPLRALLQVRGFKEDQARSAAAKATQAVNTAQKAVHKAQETLDDYRVWRGQEEARRYAAVLGKHLEKKDMDAFRSGLAALLEKEAALVDELGRAEDTLEMRQQEADQAVTAMRQSIKDHMHIEEHHSQWQEAVKLEVERQEEKEQEG